MNILLVEDDHNQARLLTEKLSIEFPSAQVHWVKTESTFRSALARLVARPPDLVVIDVMLRWADPAPEMPEPPEDVKKDGFYRAGLRCQKLLAKQRETENIPVILYTVLEYSDLSHELESIGANVTYARKHSDLSPLIAEIRRRTTK